MKLINRPMLILSGENGFVCHHKNSNTLDANRSVYDIFSLIFSDGAYNIKSQFCPHSSVQSHFKGADCQQMHPAAGASGRFWYVSGSGLVCSDGEKPEDFFLEFVEHGRVAIKGANGKYLRGDQGGTLMADGTTIDASSLWEYWPAYWPVGTVSVSPLTKWTHVVTSSHLFFF